jgi:hypothetical protein
MFSFRTTNHHTGTGDAISVWLRLLPRCDHGSLGSRGVSGRKDDVIAFQIAMHHLVAVRFGKPFAKLKRDGAGGRPSKRSAAKTVGQRLSIENLHAEELDFAFGSGSGVDIENPANAGITDLSRVAHLWREAVAKPGLAHLIATRRPSLSSVAS